jgi:hypothetical protein
VDEAVESFLRQDYEEKELIVCNDTPMQRLTCERRGVRVINLPERFASLGEKIRYMIDAAEGDAFCRWDDDDINLPHRLRLSVERLGKGYEWHPKNYVYAPLGSQWKIDARHANVHVSAIFTRACVEKMGGYPVVQSGCEDQAFMRELQGYGIPSQESILSREEIFYIYRWDVGNHLSGVKRPGWDALQEKYEAMGKDKIEEGLFEINPKWQHDYQALVPMTY